MQFGEASDTSCSEEGNTIVQDIQDVPGVMRVKCTIKFSLKVRGVLLPVLRQASPQKFQSKAELEAAVCIAPLSR